jgi:hypothetical protein
MKKDSNGNNDGFMGGGPAIESEAVRRARAGQPADARAATRQQQNAARKAKMRQQREARLAREQAKQDAAKADLQAAEWAKRRICQECGDIGIPEKHMPGSLLLQIVLFLFWLLPGIIYTIYRIAATKTICPSCKTTEPMLPLNSPRGKKLFAEFYPGQSQEEMQAKMPIEAGATVTSSNDQQISTGWGLAIVGACIAFFVIAANSGASSDDIGSWLVAITLWGVGLVVVLGLLGAVVTGIARLFGRRQAS